MNRLTSNHFEKMVVSCHFFFQWFSTRYLTLMKLNFTGEELIMDKHKKGNCFGKKTITINKKENKVSESIPKMTKTR